ncbi:hypothetical protein CLOM_g6391 [Closterium sp. NIES-68]|nr:hypothetical protein CLOM_g6391 [Closterium sp. NIES-68]
MQAVAELAAAAPPAGRTGLVEGAVRVTGGGREEAEGEGTTGQASGGRRRGGKSGGRKGAGGGQWWGGCRSNECAGEASFGGWRPREGARKRRGERRGDGRKECEERAPARVILKRGRAALFASASPAPLVFSGAVDCVLGRPPPRAGDLVVLAARRGEQGGAGGGGEEGEGGGAASGEWSQGVAVAWGVFNPTSMYRVRIMQTLTDAHRHPEAVLSMPSLLRLRLASSLHLRLLLGLSPLPCPATASGQGVGSSARGIAGGTNAFRLVNSEGDRLSGLIVDVYGDRMVVASSAAWVEAHRLDVVHALSHLLPAGGASTQGRAEGSVDGGERREGVVVGGLEGHERIIWRRSVEMLREEGVVVEGGEGEGRTAFGGEKADGEDDGEFEKAGEAEGVEEGGTQAMVDGNGGAQEGRMERGAALEVNFDHQATTATTAADRLPQSPLSGATPEPSSDGDRVKVWENGVLFWVAMASGQKTGFYSDQRDSRLLVRSLVASSLLGHAGSTAHGGNAAEVNVPSPALAHRPLSRVLDLCCYSGGFAINAALAGAADVTAVDSSPSALSLAAANVALNGLPPSAVRFERADISAFMQHAVAEQRQWDLVVLDPPKLAPTRKSLPRALHRYRRLNSLALRLVAPGGLLMTCSCSGAVSQQHLLPGILREAAASAGRQVTVVREAGAAPCHPIDPACPEGTYLTNLLALVH